MTQVAYDKKLSEATVYSPFYANYGRQPNLFFPQVVGQQHLDGISDHFG